jgi:AraC family transcriptional regulator
MNRMPGKASAAADEQSPAPDIRAIAAGNGWAIREYTCHAGPQHRPFEETHSSVTICVVVAGSFTYQGEAGRALLHPGAMLLGNHGRCFQCGHDHGTGDRCIVFDYAPEFFAEVAASRAGSAAYRFAAAMLPAANDLIPAVARSEAIVKSAPALRREEAAIAIAERVIGTLSGYAPAPAGVSPRDERRIAVVLHHIERNAGEPLDLEALAGIAGRSKYHFLRLFRRIVGMTPYQYVLSIRLRRAALDLTAREEGVAAIAYEAGFGDLSTFNTRFRALLGTTPLAWRRQARTGQLPPAASQ